MLINDSRVPGRGLPRRRCDRGDAHTRKVVPRRSGPLSQLPQYNARTCRPSSLLHAPGWFYISVNKDKMKIGI